MVEARIFALSLTGNELTSEPPTESGLSSNEDDGAAVDYLLFDDHINANRRLFHQKFPGRRLKPPQNIVMIGTVSNEKYLYASSLRVNFIDPYWCRGDGYLRERELDEFHQFCLKQSSYLAGERERLWLLVTSDSNIQNRLGLVSRRNRTETDVLKWFAFMMGMISNCFGNGSLRSCTAARFGIGGALAYTNPTDGSPVEGAAYVSRLDDCYLRAKEKTPFAGIEFKYVSFFNNCPWHNINSALPQTLCALSGHKDCSVGLFLCNLGFVLIWREQEGRDVDGVMIYTYYIFPPRVSDPDLAENMPRVPLMRECFTRDNGPAGRLDLLRVMFEIALVSFVPFDRQSESPERRLTKRLKTSRDGPEDSDNDNRRNARTRPGAKENEKSKPQKFGVSSQSRTIGYFTCFSAPEDEFPADEFVPLRE